MKLCMFSINTLKSIAVLFCMAILFSCKNDLKNIQEMSVVHKFPQGETYNFRLVYTDSTRVVAIVTSPQNNDFSNQKFPYWEFPKGIKVDFFDRKTKYLFIIFFSLKISWFLKVVFF